MVRGKWRIAFLATPDGAAIFNITEVEEASRETVNGREEEEEFDVEGEGY